MLFLAQTERLSCVRNAQSPLSLKIDHVKKIFKYGTSCRISSKVKQRKAVKIQKVNFSASKMPDQIVKLAILGDHGTGKSSLIERHLKDHFQPDKEWPKAGISYNSCWHRDCNNANVDVEVKLWELPADESHSAVAACYAAEADGILLLFDAQRPEPTINFLQKQYASNDWQQCAMLVGCKCNEELHDQFPDKMRLGTDSSPAAVLPLRMVSASTGSGVDSLFKEIVNAVLQKRVQVEQVADQNLDADKKVQLRQRAAKMGQSVKRTLSIGVRRLSLAEH